MAIALPRTRSALSAWPRHGRRQIVAMRGRLGALAAKVIYAASRCAKNGSPARDPAHGKGEGLPLVYARPRAVSGVTDLGTLGPTLRKGAPPRRVPGVERTQSDRHRARRSPRAPPHSTNSSQAMSSELRSECTRAAAISIDHATVAAERYTSPSRPGASAQPARLPPRCAKRLCGSRSRAG
jgi:hypothetical protein